MHATHAWPATRRTGDERVLAGLESVLAPAHDHGPFADTRSEDVPPLGGVQEPGEVSWLGGGHQEQMLMGKSSQEGAHEPPAGPRSPQTGQRGAHPG